MNKNSKHTPLKYFLYRAFAQNAVDIVKDIARQCGTKNIRELLNEIDGRETQQPKIQIFSVDHAHGDERQEITDLCWFEENGVHSFDEQRAWTGNYTYEIFVGGVMVWPILTGVWRND